MRKAILMVLLVIVSSNAAAEWVKVGSTATGALYVGSGTTRRVGDTVKMWGLLDFKTAQENVGNFAGKSYLSSKQQIEYECKEGQWRKLCFSWHSGNMGSGEIVLSDAKPDKWGPVTPDSGVETFRNFACGKR